MTAHDVSSIPPPPRLHWALVLLFTVLTLGIFYIVWMFVQARWVRTIDPASNAMTLSAVYVVLFIAGEIIAAAGGEAIPPAWVEQLAMGGRLVAPMHVAGGAQALVVLDKTPQGVTQTVLEAVHFVPLKSGVA